MLRWINISSYVRVVCAAFFWVVLNCPASAQFETRATSITPAQPDAIALGDFNHDGRLDLAVVATGTYTNDIAVLLGRGDGTFRPAVYYTAGIGAISIATADLNQDGNLDLAIASQSGYISILLGNSDGTFQSPTQSPPVPAFEVFVTVGDFNGDGKPDLLALTESNPCKCISVLFGNGDGTFQNPVTTTPPFSVQTLGVGDFNGDGKLDIATAGENGQQKYVNILLGNGDGTFRQGASYSGDTSPAAITVADFNGDHKPDFAVANFEGVGLSVWLGNGDGTFKSPVDYATPYPEWITSARLNEQGKLDLIAANFGASTGSAGATVFSGNGDGTFRTGVFYPAGKETRFVAVGDLNEDGQLDLVIPDYLSEDVNILLNTGTVSFSPTTPMAFTPQLVGTTSSSQTVTLTNQGKTPLTIASISASGSFEVNNTCGKKLAVGAACDLNISFKPSGKGNIPGLITVVDSATSKPQIIEVSGVGTVVELTPQSLNFGEQKVGTRSGPLPIVITNQGVSSIAISQITTNSANYSETNNCPSQLASGASCTVKVTFKPVKAGTMDAILNVKDSGGGASQSVTLTGIGD